MLGNSPSKVEKFAGLDTYSWPTAVIRSPLYSPFLLRYGLVKMREVGQDVRVCTKNRQRASLITAAKKKLKSSS